MTFKLTKVTLSGRAMRDVLRSQNVQKELEQRAERVKARAESAAPDGVTVTVDGQQGKNRTHVRVTAHGGRPGHVAEDPWLASSLDAARGQ